MEIAALGLRVDGVDNIGKASQSLDRLTKSSKSADQASGGLAAESRNTSKSLADVAREGDKSSAAMSKLAGAAKLAAGAFAGIKLGSLIKDVTMANSRFEQLGLVMGVVGRNADLSSGQMARYAKEVQGMGISMTESRQTVIRMTQAQMDLSKASDLARLAQDAAVIANTNSSDALGRMIYGLQSGQVEILRTMGLNVNFAGSYSKLAAEMGITADQLSEVDKVQARTNAVMEAGIGIAGAYDASMENAGKQLGSTTRYLQDLGVMWGEVFSDAARESIFGYSDALKGMHNTTKRMFEDGTLKKISEAISALTHGLVAVSAVIMGRVVSAGYAASASFAAAQVQAVRYQATLAAMAGVSTSAAVGITTLSVAARAASGAMALLGGPVGVAVVAASAILYFATSASKAEREADELDARIQKLGSSFSSLNAAQAAAAILDYQEKLDSASLAVSAAENTVESLTNAIRSIRDDGAVARWERELVIAKGAVGDANDVVAVLQEKIAQLTAIVDQNTASQNANNAAVAGIGSAAESYIKSIEERTAAIIDGNDPIKQANRHIKEHGQYSEEEAAAILKAAQANKDATAAQKAATSATKSGSAAVKAHKSDIQELTARLFPAQAAQAKYNAELAILKKHLSGDQLARAVSKLTKEFTGGDADGAAKAIEEYNKNLKTLVDRLNPAAVAARTFREEQELLLDAIARTGDPTGELARSLATLEQQYAETSRTTSEWTKWTESALERVDGAFADAWRNIGGGFEGFRKNLTNAFKQMLAELAHMAITRPIVMQIGAAMGIGGGGAVSGIGGMISNAGGGGMGSIANLASSAYSALTGWGPAALAGYQSGGISGALSGVGGYYGGMLSGGLGGFQAGVQGAYLAPGLAGPTTAGAGGMMGAGSMVGNAAAYAPWLGGIGGAFMGYQNSGLKGAAAGGLGGWGGAKLGAIAGANLGPVGAAVGAIAGGILGSLGGSKLFGSGEKYKRVVGSATGYYGDDGYVSTGPDANFHPGARQFGEDYDNALDEVVARFTTTIGSLYDVFGEDIEVSGAANTRIRRTSGRLAADFISVIDGEVTEYFRQYSGDNATGDFVGDVMGEYLAKTIVSSSLPEYFRQQFEPLAADSKVTAEQVAETLTEIFTRFDGVNSVLELTRHAAFELTDAGMRASDAIIALSGGLDALSANAATYYDNFFSAEEKTEDAIDAITRAFKDAEVTLTGSRESYRAAVEAIDLTSEAGQEMFAKMMALAGHAAQYFDIIEQRVAQAAQAAAQAAANAVNASMAQANSAYSALERSIAAERKRITAEFNAAAQAQQAAQQAASQAAASRAQAQAASLSASMDISKRLIDIFRQIDNAVKRALDRLMSTDTAVVAMRREQSLSIVRGALASGSLADIDGLADAIAASSVIDSASYKTAVELQREQGRTANLISDLGELNSKQLSAEEKIYDRLRTQLEYTRSISSSVSSGFSGVSASLQAKYDADMAALDKELEAAKLQMDALSGVDNSIMSVREAVNAMNASVVAAIHQQNKFVSGDTSKTVLGSSAATSSNEGLEATIKRMYQSTLGYEADAQGVKHWTDRIKSGESLSVMQNALTRAAASAAAPKIPAFASGGFHSGGLRIVGENGPEIEATGSARIFNAAQTENILNGSRSGDSTSAAITRLESTIAQQGDALRAIAKHTHQTARRVETLERWDFDGMPEQREAI